MSLVARKLKDSFFVFIHQTVVCRRKGKHLFEEERPTISGLIFVQGNSRDVQARLDSLFFGLYLVKDCSTKCVARIADEQMQVFMNMAATGETHLRFMPHPFDYYAEGHALVRITSGKLVGLEGYVVRMARNKCIVTSIGGMTVAIGGVHKETFENITAYISQRRDEQDHDGMQGALTDAQRLIDADFFSPTSQLDALVLAQSIARWQRRAEAETAACRFSTAAEIELFLLEEIGCRCFKKSGDGHAGECAEIKAAVSEAVKLLDDIAAIPALPVNVREAIETGLDSLAVRFPALDLSSPLCEAADA